VIFTKKYTINTLKHNYETIKGFGIRKIGIFGSILNDKLNDNSDIDILVEFEEGHETFNNILKLYELFENLFDRKIDIVTPGSLSQYIAPYILKEIEYVEESH